MTKKLYKDKKNAVIGGVCAGLAEYFNFDVTIVRLGMVLLGLMWGTGIVLYIVAMIIMPDKSAVIDETIKNAGPDDENKE
jgi:phage shock protein C